MTTTTRPKTRYILSLNVHIIYIVIVIVIFTVTVIVVVGGRLHWNSPSSGGGV